MLYQNPLQLDASVCDKHYWHRNRANTSPHLFAKERTKDLRSKDAKKIHALFRQRNDEHVPFTMSQNNFWTSIRIFNAHAFSKDLSSTYSKVEFTQRYTRLIYCHPKFYVAYFLLIFLWKYISLYALSRLYSNLDAIWPLNSI